MKFIPSLLVSSTAFINRSLHTDTLKYVVLKRPLFKHQGLSKGLQIELMCLSLNKSCVVYKLYNNLKDSET